MRLCHIVPSLREQHGGPSKSVRALCRALARSGHTVELLSMAPGAPRHGETIEHSDNLTITVFRQSSPMRLCVSAGLRSHLAKSGAELVHCHALWLRTLHYAHRHCTARSIPLVVSPRGMMNRWAWHHHRCRKILSGALVHPGALRDTAGWHATSHDEARDIAELGFTQRCVVAPNGVDEPSSQEVESAVAFWHAACPQTASRPTALFYGRFHQKKRVIELIDAWVEHAPRDWLLLLVGIPDGYSPETLEAYAHRLSASDRVRAFDGLGRPAPYAVASLFLLPSHSENFGLTVAESMVHGVPALVTDTTPWQAMNDLGHGWCVPWSDYGVAITKATAEGPERLRARGVGARQWAVHEFSWGNAASTLSEFYRSLTLPRQ